MWNHCSGSDQWKDRSLGMNSQRGYGRNHDLRERQAEQGLAQVRQDAAGQDEDSPVVAAAEREKSIALERNSG